MGKKNKQEKQNKKDKAQDSELQNIIEAALLSAQEPVGIRKIMGMFPADAQPSKVDVQNVILQLQEQCEHRGIELKRIGKGWRYQSKEKYSPWLRKLKAQKPPRYSRAQLETLAIIAYRQPVTRGDIEEIRGVGVSSDTIRTLEEREWVAQIGHRDVPGRPALFGTTQNFLEYFNMESLRELPELMDKRELGEIAKDINLTLPMDGVKQEDDQHSESEQKDSEQPTESAEIIELPVEGREINDANSEDEEVTDNSEESEVKEDSSDKEDS